MVEDPTAEPVGKKTKRLMISHMKLVNFKSYAGTKIIGPFHKKFSAVVGPNGSGKSNVIDAMLFVFGRRASKLRLKKVSQLIHNSAFHPDCTKCEVSVYFQEIVDKDEGGDNDFDIVPGSKFVVSREAFKDNKSRYAIDGKTSNFTKVTNTLREKGIDLDNNRFLILQGEVEQISLMKPKAATQYEVGMLEYLEDIIGSNTFVEPIEEAAQKVKGFEDERLLVLQKTVALEKARDELEGSKTEAEDFLNKEREIVRLNAIQSQVLVAKSTRAIAETEQKIQDADARRRGEQDKLKQKEQEVIKSKGEYERISADHARIAEEVKACKKEWATFERKDIKYREDIKHAKHEAKKASAAIKRNKKKADERAKEALRLEESIPSLEDAIESAKKVKEAEETKLEAVYESIKGKTEELRVEMKKKEKELEPWRQKVDDASAKAKTTKTELDLLKEQTQAGQRRFDEARAALKSFETREAKLLQTMEATRSEEVSAASEEASVTEELRACSEKIKACEIVLREKRAAVEGARLAQRMQASQGTLLKKLLRASRSGGPLVRVGLFGRLGDLGAIDSKYDVAVSTAASALDHLVVQNTAGAQACIQFLRRNNLGRATFICLDELGYLKKHMEKKIVCPNGVPRLFDLVQVKDDRLRPAFFFALRNTLVAPDLDQATNIAYGGTDGKARWRVVTLAGQLIDVSGTMSGGGRPRKGRMGAAVVDTKAAEQHSLSEREYQDASHRIKSLRKQRSDLESRAKQLKKKIHKLQLRISKIDMEMKSLPEERATLESELKAAEAQLGESAASSKATQSRIAALEKKLKAETKRLADAKRGAESLEKIVANLQSQILDAGGESLRSQKAAVTKAVRSLKAATSALSKARVDIKSHMKEASKAEKKCVEAEKKEAKFTKTVESIRKELTRMDEDAQELLTRREQAQVALKEREKALRSIEADFRKVKKVVAEIKLALVDIESQHEELTKTLKRKKNVETHWREKFAELAAKYEQMPRIVMSKDDASDENAVSKSAEEEAEKTAKKLPTLSAEELKEYDEEKLANDIVILENERDRLKNTINMSAIEEYRAKAADHRRQLKELDKVTVQRDGARSKHDALRKKRLEMFSAGFFKIKMKLKEMYRMLTLGGDAELEQVDTLDPFSEGILFSVRPPRKSWKSISNLSGGEKTLCSLALVFALHHFRPTPLYVMDEIDAALDFKNVSIIANYIKDRADGAQFIVISLRNNMFELADRLVGIYKTNDATKSVTINPKAVAKRGSLTKAKAAIAMQDRTNVAPV